MLSAPVKARARRRAAIAVACAAVALVSDAFAEPGVAAADRTAAPPRTNEGPPIRPPPSWYGLPTLLTGGAAQVAFVLSDFRSAWGLGVGAVLFLGGGPTTHALNDEPQRAFVSVFANAAVLGAAAVMAASARCPEDEPRECGATKREVLLLLAAANVVDALAFSWHRKPPREVTPHRFGLEPHFGWRAGAPLFGVATAF